ncbi:MAG: hypothetical protein KQH83_00765, partial [Actinobacteria bacterium]|nr:hypothetical protein [Actinomycetota bacterium]
MPRLAVVGVPAAYRRGLESAAPGRGWGIAEDPSSADVVVAPLRSPDDCRAVETLAAGAPVVALVSPLDRDTASHALRHGAAPADWDWEPQRILDAVTAASAGDAVLPLAAARALAGNGGACASPSLSDEEAGWLLALSRGTTVVRLADDTGHSERAMFRRLSELYARLGARNRAEAVVAAERLGLLDRG